MDAELYKSIHHAHHTTDFPNLPRRTIRDGDVEPPAHLGELLIEPLEPHEEVEIVRKRRRVGKTGVVARRLPSTKKATEPFSVPVRAVPGETSLLRQLPMGGKEPGDHSFPRVAQDRELVK